MRKIVVFAVMSLFLGLASTALADVYKLDRGITITLPSNWQVETYKAGQRGDGQGTSMLLNAYFLKPGDQFPAYGIAIGAGPVTEMITQQAISAMRPEDIQATSKEIKEGVSAGFKNRNMDVQDWQYEIGTVDGLKALHWTFTASESRGEVYMEQYQIPTPGALVNMNLWCRMEEKSQCLPAFQKAVSSVKLK